MIARASLVLFVAASPAFAAITIGSLDRFTTTVEGWETGKASTSPTRSSSTGHDGQPGFLFHDSDGGGSGGKWIMWSFESDWMGDYQSAGVTAIDFWANNQSGSARNLWLQFDGPGGSVVSQPIVLPGNGQWEPYQLDLSDLSYYSGSGGTGDVGATLANVNQFVFMADDATSLGYAGDGDVVAPGSSVSEIWIDDIAAVPEPSALALVSGLLALGLANARRRS